MCFTWQHNQPLAWLLDILLLLIFIFTTENEVRVCVCRSSLCSILLKIIFLYASLCIFLSQLSSGISEQIVSLVSQRQRLVDAVEVTAGVEFHLV